MTVSHAVGDVYAVDPELMGAPGALTLYVVDAPEPALVDTGSANSSPHIYEALSELGIDRTAVRHVLVLHVHLDHAGGAGHLAEALPNATFYLHPEGRPYVTDAAKLSRLKHSVDKAMGVENAYGAPELLDEDRCRTVTDGDRIDVGDRALEIADAPGHAPHHVAAFDPATGGLFSIDAAGMHLAGEMRPTTPPPGFDLEANLETVDRLRAFEPSVHLYGHVGPGGEDAVAELDRYGAMLPEWVDVVAGRRETFGEDVDTIVDSLESRWLSPTVGRDVAGVLHYLNETGR